jgi:membrane-bound metal-dependent hydrolase YbcI (DUF457 family)
MPFTPYHFGPSGFIGLVFGKWIDLPVFVLANVIVDIEVLVVMLFGLGWPHHRYCHTLLGGALIGALWGLGAYPLRRLFKSIMQVLYIPYKTSLRKMVISGILGVWLHVLIDGLYHFDVKMFWPFKTEWLRQTLHRLITQKQIETICIFFLVAAFIFYISAFIVFRKNRVKDNE